ncbi:RagB/SusD family nutrient uptake outer membrane protein [Joostella atrarenae]|uniref:RagB/SusD family nutrient uptake outer membrane protein n=1 Tax=Joostella atrarenae TaxID=679257 RepID=A0ABS9J6F5_9FLAO|nr:RagB/SusD family nutrient uptake outer membrane protein [Joostella atrarenae]MCF8716007.1 RagB/SusD family nutrient uptake outer membrane protein [Joostella atrarenae]
MKKVLYITILAIRLTACNLTDSIDQDPPNNLVPENVVTNEDDAKALLNGAYSQIISYTNSSYYMYSEIIPSALIGSMTINSSSDEEIFDNDILAENATVRNFWSIFYSVIDAANNTIANTEKLSNDLITPEAKKEIIGEAHFLRAMATFDALRYFGQFYDSSSNLGVILRTEPVNFVTRSIKRSSVQESYSQILSDLDYAISNAPDFTVSYRGSKTAAKALKARVLLYNGQYNEAANIADQVINEGTTSLETNFSDVFDKGYNASENILVTFRDSESDNDENNRKRFYAGRVADGWFTDLMENDPRKEASYSGTTVLKTNNENSFRPTFFIRLAEMYLIKAEGISRSTGDVEAAKIPLNKIIERADADLSTATSIEELNDNIFNQYIKEMAYENGSDWFAAIRFEKAMDLKPSITSVDQYILPIPTTEIEGNEFLTLADQNPGYE